MTPPDPVRQKLIRSVAETIKDYRAAELGERRADHIDRWVRQFDENVQLPLLSELGFILRRSYLSTEYIDHWISVLAEGGPGIVENDVDWADVAILDIQRRGNSQHALAVKLAAAIGDGRLIGPDDHAVRAKKFLYVDDVAYTGGRIVQDLSAWVADRQEPTIEIIIARLANYHSATRWVLRAMFDLGHRLGKQISIEWWPSLFTERVQEREFENSLNHASFADVLWPQSLPDGPDVFQWSRGLSLKFRPDAEIPANQHQFTRSAEFASERGRALLETEFLKAGARILEKTGATNFLPLGGTKKKAFDSMGFGSMLVTHRNISNNSPLALWWDVPASGWIPLFPRRHED